MLDKKFVRRIVYISLLCLTFSACAPKPPFNDFKKEPPNVKRTITGAGVGAAVGALAGNAVVGVAVGGVAGTLVGVYRENKRNIVNELEKQNIQFIEYGDTMTLVVPTDHYYEFNSPRLNEICYAGLNNIVRLLKFYPCSRIYVAGFTDNIGPTVHKNKLSQAQAETMIGFLWANGIPAKYLRAEGYGEKNPLGDNRWIHGSAFNRRIEIKWLNVPDNRTKRPTIMSAMK
jgi:outer membrane protein OmpA-like peptidoglycan-associated protein